MQTLLAWGGARAAALRPRQPQLPRPFGSALMRARAPGRLSAALAVGLLLCLSLPVFAHAQVVALSPRPVPGGSGRVDITLTGSNVAITGAQVRACQQPRRDS